MTTWENILHWKLARKCNFEAGDKCYEHERESILENEDYKILWDFSIQTDHVIEARRPDLVLVDMKERICKITDFTVPRDSKRRRRKIRLKNIKTWEGSNRRYGRPYHHL